jgi:hypothetical protein
LATGLHEVGLIIGAARSGGSLPIERQNPSRDSLFSHNADRTIPGIASLAQRREEKRREEILMIILSTQHKSLPLRRPLSPERRRGKHPRFTPPTLGEYYKLTDLIRPCWAKNPTNELAMLAKSCPRLSRDQPNRTIPELPACRPAGWA